MTVRLTKKTIRALFLAMENPDGYPRPPRDAEIAQILDTYPEALEANGVGKVIYEGKTPLMFALQCGLSGVSNLLLDRAANVHSKMTESWGWPVLHFAVRAAISGTARKEDVTVLQRILDLGADPRVRDAFGNSALHRALLDYHVKWDRYPIIEILLRHGADADEKGAAGVSCRELVGRNPQAYAANVRKLF